MRSFVAFAGLLAACLASTACGTKSAAPPPATTTRPTTTTAPAPPAFPTTVETTASCTPAARHTYPTRRYINNHLKLDVKEVKLLFTTNCGQFVVTIDKKTSPRAASSFVSLAQRGFYDDTFFHRIVPGFVIQGGDPTGTGSGGPAYQTHDKVPKTVAYTYGVVAMAKAPTEPAGTAGSQFFIVTVRNANLPPDYAVVGKVTSGFATVNLIGTLGNAQQQPTRNVVISKVTLGIKK
jgi:cyclophilin family peptidyl-prolyl cis-trans isomerase